jgi:DNA topoisomerase II
MQTLVSFFLNMTDSADLSKQYQRKTDKQHILDNPDTYIGSVENVDAQMWVYDDASQKITLKDIEYVPGLYKLFDEGIVNCRDHVIRMIHSPILDKRYVSYIETSIAQDGTIMMANDGNGIDIAKHPEYDIWIPEMIFGQLRTSTNYDKNEKKIVGGKNGFGFKLVLIWSEYGKIETVDHTRGLKYVQEFKRNLDEICPPVITKVTGAAAKPYTKVWFKPDYRRLGVPGLTPDMLALLKKRVYDIGAVTDHTINKIKVILNGEKIPVKNFQNYIDLYLGGKTDVKRIYEEGSERWEYAVALSPTHEFIQVSFVNGICTFKGGKHVDYIVGQIVRKLCDYIEKKKKIKVNAAAIKEQIILFLRCDVENPSFDSQTKDFMNTPSAKFGSTCSVSDGFIEKVAKMGVMDVACSLVAAKENKLAKKTDGAKTKNVRGIANFIDANDAGTPKSKDCVLILCEGLSALSGIVSGLSSSDRNTIGIYPLKGKLLNVRGEKAMKISENKEIGDIKKILGLETGRNYATITDVNQNLRYGKILFMTDQDLDGSHIKALCVNLFHSEWASLIKIPGFLSFMNTPILRAKKGNVVKLFYNDGEYKTWKDSLGATGISGWTVKYFKGLGTSQSADFKQYFANKKVVDFVYTGQGCDDTIDKVFNKKRADDRKTWLENYDKEAYVDTNQANVQYNAFVDKELIHFSTYDNARSIPNMMDGLKTSLRKILFCAFKRKLTSEIKVAQFSGYVSEHSAYHHGEASLNGAIVNMAQNFVGSNNVNLLLPNGQFGTRLQGGDDSASERYIFTQLSPVARYIFPEADDAILHYLDDDGTEVEPEWYAPILPFALLNGQLGIGTGFSTSIPSYNPKQVIQHLKTKLADQPSAGTEFVPYYEGFKGTVSKIADKKFLIKGCYEKVAEDKIRITELPVGTWTMPYVSFLESLVDGQVDKAGKKSAPVIKDFTSVSTEVTVDILVTFPKDRLRELETMAEDYGCNGVHKLLKLTTTVSTTNMHMFDAKLKLHKYDSVEEIIDDFYGVRLNMYQKRKDYLVVDMEKKLVKLSNRARYIQMTLEGTVDLRRKTAVQVTELLTGLKFAVLDGDYKYLIKMTMDSVTSENVAAILKEKADTEMQLETLKATTLEKMWLTELQMLEVQYEIYKGRREKLQEATSSATDKKKVVVKKVVAKK